MTKTAQLELKNRREAAAQIKKRRTQCLVHRYLYYVKNEPIISDYQYDMMERELKALCEKYPEVSMEVENYTFCPSHTVGAEDPENYPRHIEQLAESLLAHTKGTHIKLADEDDLCATEGGAAAS